MEPSDGHEQVDSEAVTAFGAQQPPPEGSPLGQSSRNSGRPSGEINKTRSVNRTPDASPRNVSVPTDKSPPADEEHLSSRGKSVNDEPDADQFSMLANIGGTGSAISTGSGSNRRVDAAVTSALADNKLKRYVSTGPRRPREKPP